MKNNNYYNNRDTEILNYVLAHPDITAPEVSNAMGINITAVYKCLNKQVDKGELTTVKGFGKSKMYRKALSDASEAANAFLYRARNLTNEHKKGKNHERPYRL